MSWEYDAVGNWVYETVNGVQTRYSYDDNDRLTQQGGVSYTYDANGNTLSESEDGQSDRYRYDARNRLIAADVNGTSMSLSYDPDGNRTAKSEYGLTTRSPRF